MGQDEVLYSHARIGEFLGVSSDFVGALVKREGLPVARWGKHRLTTTSAVLAWLTRKAEANGKKA